MRPVLPNLVLYSFRRCPYAMRARLALLVSGQVCELREVVLAHKPTALLEASPKGTVPVLIDPDGRLLDQSLDIMLWALQRNDPQHWLSAGDPVQSSEDALPAMLALVAQCDGEFKFHLDRYKYPNRQAEPNAPLHRAAGAHFLAVLNSRLGDYGNLFSGGTSLADAAIAPFVRQFAHTDPAWFAAQAWGPLQGWLKAFEASPAFARVMEKYAPWAPEQPTQLFPSQAKPE
jgi:glutathione S-transferase